MNETEYPKTLVHLSIKDTSGKILSHREIEIWIDGGEPMVGDELTLSYSIPTKYSPQRRYTKVIVTSRRRSCSAPPHFKSINGIESDLTVWSSGRNLLTLVCIPATKDGGLEGIKRLLAFYKKTKAELDPKLHKRLGF